MKKVFNSPNELLGREGEILAPTSWMKITQERINEFANATDDQQWIHVDVEKAKQGPFGVPIAHGYLTLSLAAKFLFELVEIQNISMGLNYGVNKARFPNTVKVGSNIRAHGEFITVEEIKGCIQLILRITVEIEGEEKPACVVDTISRYYPM